MNLVYSAKIFCDAEVLTRIKTILQNLNLPACRSFVIYRQMLKISELLIMMCDLLKKIMMSAQH